MEKRFKLSLYELLKEIFPNGDLLMGFRYKKTIRMLFKECCDMIIKYILLGDSIEQAYLNVTNFLFYRVLFPLNQQL